MEILGVVLEKENGPLPPLQIDQNSNTPFPQEITGVYYTNGS